MRYCMHNGYIVLFAMEASCGRQNVTGALAINARLHLTPNPLSYPGTLGRSAHHVETDTSAERVLYTASTTLTSV